MLDDWTLTTLGEVAHVEMGQSPPSAFVSEHEVGLAFLQGNAEFSDLHPQPKLWCRKPAKNAFAGDALISVRAPVGALNRADQDYCIGRGLAAIRFGSVDPNFGYHALGLYAKALRRVAQGTTFEAVGGTELRQLEFPDAPAPEQRRIAEILDTIDEAIRRTEQVIAKLQQMKQGLLHDLLTRGIDENGELRDPDRHPEQFKDWLLGRTPIAWDVRPIEELATTYAGGTPSRAVPRFYGGSVPWVKSAEVNKATITETEERISERALRSSSVKWVPAGTPLVAMYGATAGVVGWLGIRATTNQAVLALVAGGEFAPRFLYWALVFGAPRLLASVQGSGQPNLSKKVIDKARLAVPRESIEQVEIATRLDCFQDRIQDEAIELDKLRTLKRGLMDDLLTGRVRAPQLEEVTA